jgi:hypothetical protein
LTSPEDELELEKLRVELENLRRELIFTRIVAFGLLLVVFLSLFGASRIAAMSAFFAVGLVAVFLSLRWGIGDTALTLGKSIGWTLALAAVLLLLLLWVSTK